MSGVIDRVEVLDLHGHETPTLPYWNCDRHPGETRGAPRLVCDPDGGPRPVHHRYLRIRTSDGGAGWYGPVDEDACRVLAAGMAASVIGLDPRSEDLVWQTALASQRHRGGPTRLGLAALDLACWDLRGRLAELPVYRLWGPAVRPDIPWYATMLGAPPDHEGRLAWCRLALEQGFVDQKWKLRTYPGDDWTATAAEIETLLALRSLLGDGLLGVDANRMGTAPFAEALIGPLGEAAVDFLEEPLADHDLDGWCALGPACAGRLTLAGGEHLLDDPTLDWFLERRLLGIVQIDPEWCGGLTWARRACERIAAAGAVCMPHGHGLRAAWHLLASLDPAFAPRGEWLLHKMQQHWGWFERDWPRPVDGRLPLPTEVGLGCEFAEERIEHRELRVLATATRSLHEVHA